MLYLIEGMDKVGKSTAASILRTRIKGNYVHMTAPAKWHTRETYFAEMLHTIALTAQKNVVIDRTWYGEAVWPQVYNRVSLLTDDDMETLTEAALALHDGAVHKLYMFDDDAEAHLKRMSEFKEPAYDVQLASRLYDDMTRRHGFMPITLPGAIKLWT
jgi:thymidylate kinase